MATFAKKNDHWYMTIVKGDTLWGIGNYLYTQYEAKDDPGYTIVKDTGTGIFKKNGDNSGNATATYFATNMARWNDIPNKNLIYPGEVFWLTYDGAKAAKTQSSPSITKAVIKQFGVKSTSEDGNDLFASWTWTNVKRTDHYEAQWVYDSGDNLWYTGKTEKIDVDISDEALSRVSQYTIPSDEGVRRVRFRVKPIATTYDDGVAYFNAPSSDPKYHTDLTPVETPTATPTVTIDSNLKMTIELNGLDNNIAKVQFQVIKNNSSLKIYHTTNEETVETSSVTVYVSVDAGAKYKVRYRVWDMDNQKSDWSDYTDNYSSKPNAPEWFSWRANDETSVYLSWTKVETAISYEVQYSTDMDLLKLSNDVSSETFGDENNHVTAGIITGLETGTEYFFRLRALNGDAASDWSEGIIQLAVGDKPAKPTAWSSTTTATIGDDLILYWTHNATDASWQRKAELLISINGIDLDPIVKDDYTEDDAENVSSCIFPTGNNTNITNDTQLVWQVRTWGALPSEPSDYSDPRYVKIYTKPEVHLSLLDINETSIDTMTSFPLLIQATATPSTQVPIGFYVTITSNTTYETTDTLGNTKWINTGDAIYSKHFDKNNLDEQISAGDIDLYNGMEYTAHCIVSMDSGLTAEHSLTFDVSWEDKGCEPNAEIGISLDSYTATIRPYCEEYATVCYAVTYNSTTGLYTRTAEVIDDPMGGDIIYAYRVTYDEETGLYTKTDEELEERYGTIVSGVKTTTGESVYYGTDGESDDVYFCEVKIKMRTTVGDVVYYSVDSEGNDVYYCKVEEGTPIENVLMSVYRREYDGGLTQLSENLGANVRVHDPHPSLDLARYRIVAIDQSTGTVSYTDLPGVTVGVSSVIIQWDEQWTNFETTADEEPAEPAWTGSLLKLPYNIDISTNNTLDVSLVEYIGRSHPVSYYGTQIGESATWSVEIPKTDVETIYALRRLARWMGDVYVREPSGTGYWANVGVSFNQKHNNLTIPVTLSITRVEGGM